jgi:hypothetical protein
MEWQLGEVEMKRPDWELAFAAYVEQSNGTRFRYHVHDCCTFAAGCVEAMTGTDVMARIRLLYEDRKSAIRLLRQVGGLEKIMAKVAADNGWKEIEPRFACRGDVVMFPMYKNPAVGVVSLSGRDALFVTWHGIVRVPAGRWSRAWRVG